jgi:soluble lytic murein transglycosylase
MRLPWLPVGLAVAALVVLAGIALVTGRGPGASRPGGAAGGSGAGPANVDFFPAGGSDRPVATPLVSDTFVDPWPNDPALASAAQAEYEGRYEDAAALYRPIAEAQPAQPASVDARWHLAVSLFDAGQYDAAIDNFAVYARTYPTDTRSLLAAFWAGRAHLAAGRPAAAEAEFRSYAAQGGPLRATALLLAADAATAQGHQDAVRELLNRVLAEPTTRLDRMAAWERLAALETANQAPDKAAAWYAAIAQEAHMPGYRAQMRLKAGIALLDAHEQAKGEAALRDLIQAQPDDPAAYQALHRLLDSDPQVLSAGRLPYDLACRVAYTAGKYSEAIDYCESFRTVQAPGPERAGAAWYTARAYQAAGNTTLADSWYKGFTEVYTADARLPDVLYQWAGLRASAGDVTGALTLYDYLAQAYPQKAVGADAQDQAGVLLRKQGDLAGAAEHWRIAAGLPGADAVTRARALFWQGWALQQQGQADAATALWRQGAAYHTFWGQRCLDHLAAETVVPRDNGPTAAAQDRLGALAVLDPQQETTAARDLLEWAVQWSAPGSVAPAPGELPARLRDDPAYGRAVGLAQVGMWSEARLAFDDLASTLAEENDGVALAALALQAQRARWPWIALLVAGDLQGAAAAAHAPAGIADLPRAAQEMLYPVGWPQLVAAQAQEQGVDPWLLLGLVRQESAFDPAAHSSADARGLTQVIPGTASGIAAALHLPDFQQAQLYRPAISLRFGASYLQSTLTRFDRNILYALAGYNGGPANVPDWAGGRVNDDPDLFVDNIDYRETRQYVQIVYDNYAIYHWLYGER